MRLVPVVIGSSSGGPRNLKNLLHWIGDLKTSLVIAQHNLPSYMESFAKWLEEETKKPVILVESKVILERGKVYLPAGSKNILIGEDNTVLAVKSRTNISPSIDVLFESAAKIYGKNAIAVVLGGLGFDGLYGAKRISEGGGTVIVQSDADFSYLPTLVERNVYKVMKRSLREISMFIESLEG
jgi:two-component system chemotaxis response regulator CheB